MEFKKYRPQGIFNKDDDKFISLIDRLYEFIIDVTEFFQYDTLRLDNEKFHRLAHILIEFAEDIQFDIGIWKAYENFNQKAFGTKWPCSCNEMPDDLDNDDFNFRRIQHLLWNIFGLLEPNLLLSPGHQDLSLLANEISTFISNSKNRFPKQSSVKSFIKLPEDDGYDVKKKLIWLGTRSYFFRENFSLYLIKNKYKEEIPVIDDFINQHSTSWSGLGVIDILPELIIIPQSKKDDIKSWYERHSSYYLIKSIQGKKITAENIVNKQNYRILDGGKSNLFKPDNVIFGSTVKYGNDWYWSGAQQSFESFTKEQIDKIRENFISKTSRIVYRYDKQLLEKAKKKECRII
jgi:hypothetical protein